MPARSGSEPIRLRAMRAGDLAAVLAMLRTCEGIGLRSADSPAALRRFLRRNPGMSVVALHDREVIGCAFVGHDGRRAYLHHVAVAPGRRRTGTGRRLVAWALERIRAEGIGKVHCDVFCTNRSALRFWRSLGWQRRRDIVRHSIVITDDPDA